MQRSDFGNEFIWGVATSATQIEGAANEDGRGASIWNSFEKKRRFWPLNRPTINNGENSDIACDHYHRFLDDVNLIAGLNVNAYRLSLSWSRILPEGTGAINPKGLDFYDRLFDVLLEKNITPFVTLYHWDMPQALQDKGGWSNRDSVNWLSEYISVCLRHFGDRVKHWIVLNEAFAHLNFGYLLGFHAPGQYGFFNRQNYLAAIHHSNLAQALAFQKIRAYDSTMHVGTSVYALPCYPATDSARDIASAERGNAAWKMFIDPYFGKAYPFDLLPAFQRIEKFIKSDDLKNLATAPDFIGVNYYFRAILRHNAFVPITRAAFVLDDCEKTDNGWDIYPQGLHDVLMDFAQYPVESLYVTENGSAYHDKIENSRIHDVRRTAYLQQHLQQLQEVRNKTAKLKGYFAWSLFDNFEWSDGYETRFGLYHVDFATQQRLLKDSGRWYRDFLATTNLR